MIIGELHTCTPLFLTGENDRHSSCRKIINKKLEIIDINRLSNTVVRYFFTKRFSFGLPAYIRYDMFVSHFLCL